MAVARSFGPRSVSPSRFAVVFLVILCLYLGRGIWLPQVSDYRITIANAVRPAKGQDQNGTNLDPHLPNTDDMPQLASESCRTAPGADRVLVILKTGATEISQKLPIHLATTFTCIPHSMIFSDLQQDFKNYTVHDALDSVDEKLRERHPDFALYRKLQQYQSEGQDPSTLQGTKGWTLDKWKFLPMLHSTFASAPSHIDWFVFIEADTSLSWPNLLLFLQTMNPQKPHYTGAQIFLGPTRFAHGGSGIILSRAALKALETKRSIIGAEVFDRKWEQLTAQSCCGDELVGRALKEEVDVLLSPAWPVIQGETVATLDYTAKHWCAPAVTWHHVKPDEVDALWQFQNGWVDDHGWRTPYLFRDVFEHFILPRIGGENLTGWDNLSQDKKLLAPELLPGGGGDVLGLGSLQEYERQATESVDACYEACLMQPKGQCVQWMFSPGRCYLGKVLRFGYSNEEQAQQAGKAKIEEDMNWTSGWIMDRVEKFRGKMEGCEVQWRRE